MRIANNRGRNVLAAIAGVAMVASRVNAASLLVPAYFQPSDDKTDWKQLDTAASKVSLTAIFNPNSGPGTAVDKSYTSALSALRSAGGKAIAYVHTQVTGGGLRPLADVEAEVATYRSFYIFDGFFVDEMTNDSSTTDVTFYTNLYSYIKSLNASYTVVGNPGTTVPKAYTAAADELVTYEDTSANYASNVPDKWTTSKPATTFAHMIYETPAASLTAVLAQAAAQNAGNVYVTDDGADGNPYDSLPSYWQAEVNALVPEPAMGVMFGSVGAMSLLRWRGLRGSDRVTGKDEVLS